MISLCKKGHPFTKRNTYLHPSGKRRCRICLREYQNRWSKENPDKVKGKKITYRNNHKEKIAKDMKKWRDSNKKKLAAYARKYRKENKAVIQKWLLENREKTRAHVRRWRAAKRNALGFVSQGILDLLFSLQKGKCYYCFHKLRKVHVEHKTPLSRGGKHEDKNLALSCPPCNLQKGDKTEKEFIKYKRRVKEVS